jgi:predicted 2-oxoglutarate/Fe(II)-dependent dioxygenase YbiX
VAGLFPIPQQLRGYSADRAWESEAIELTESQMSVDGRKTSGYVFNMVPQTFNLQADSPSKAIFNAIINAMKAAREVLYISGTIDLPSTGESFVCTRGTLKSGKMLPDAGKVLQPMTYTIEWESINPTIS